MSGDQTTRHQARLVDDDAVPMLSVLSGPGAGRLFELAQGRRVVLGKSEQCQLVLPYSGISREHAAVRLDNDMQLEVEDLGSTNGTYIGTTRLEAAQVLGPGERIKIGSETSLGFRFVGQSERAAIEVASQARQALAQLSSRELEVAVSVADGLTSAKIAKKLGISPRTVTTHLDHIYGRLELPSRAALTRLVIEARAFSGA